MEPKSSYCYGSRLKALELSIGGGEAGGGGARGGLGFRGQDALL